MTAYYNEHDPFAAAWLRELIKAGHIAPGIVDERSIEDVIPDELAQYTQCHFFAGIGVWSYALRCAGWPDDRPVWTGSCPCQPFSAAGKGGGMSDERHLWPAFYHLIRERRPATVYGEQVASKDGLAWLDLVQTDMEAAGYAFGAFDLCAAGFGAPHIRQRLYWVGDAEHARLEGLRRTNHGADGRPEQTGSSVSTSTVSPLAHDNDQRLVAPSGDGLHNQEHYAQPRCSAGGLADSGNGQLSQQGREPQGRDGAGSAGADDTGTVQPVNGFWRDSDWLACRDDKWRPVRPGTFPLAHGSPARVGRLRGYGNAIVAPVAQAFIEATLDFLRPVESCNT
jgi:DNA (cytosine-5)-methyltransferase 1